MRVIAGSAKGRRLFAPKGTATRPTSDRAKESLFSILGDRVLGSAVLDLYAGSGALGIEALSRGASRAVFVDAERAAIEAIGRNVEAAGFSDRTTITQAPAETILRDLADEGARFDLIFLDPPYRIAGVGLEAVVEAVAFRLTDLGSAVLEHRANLQLPRFGEAVEAFDARRYGDTGLIFFKRRED